MHAFLASEQLRRTTATGAPNINDLWWASKDVDAMRLNIKSLGYEMARGVYERAPRHPAPTPVHIGLRSKPATQADMESEWAAHWCRSLRVAPLYHRKVWEYVFVLQALFEAGVLKAGERMLGFGCGDEPVPSYLASLGVHVTATDLPLDKARARGWATGQQDPSGLDRLWKPEICERDAFRGFVDVRSADMNHIPASLAGFSATWSICALEHLGSIERGTEFVENSLRVLRPGGVAVHTTEYNFSPGEETIDNWQTVLFKRSHLEELARRLRSLGHDVAPLDFSLGSGLLDRFIDLPPYAAGEGLLDDRWNDLSPAHLKLSIDGFPCTSFGLVVRKDR